MFLREITYREEKMPNFKEFPFNLPVLNNKHFHLKFDKKVTFLVGENGAGKSTILEAIALGCGYNPSGGSRNNVYSTVQTESNLADYLRLVWNLKINQGFFLRAETFYNFASELDELKKQPFGGASYVPYGGKSLHQQSHGESFLSLFINRLYKGLFIFDEPEAALSPQRQLSFLSILHERVKSSECQFIIATHSPILLSYPGATIYELSNNGLKKIKYEESEPYSITKDFLNNPQAFQKYLFE